MAGLLRGQKDADEQKESPAVPGLRVVSNKGERLEAPEPLDVRMRSDTDKLISAFAVPQRSLMMRPADRSLRLGPLPKPIGTIMAPRSAPRRSARNSG